MANKKAKTEFQKFLEYAKFHGWLQDYCDKCGLNPSYIDRVLKKPWRKPSEQTLRNLVKFSRRRLKRSDVDKHFSDLVESPKKKSVSGSAAMQNESSVLGLNSDLVDDYERREGARAERRKMMGLPNYW